MSATDILLSCVENAKNEYERAEADYNCQVEIVQIKSSSNIDLFDGKSTRKVADIARTVREACDDFYASCQASVRILDEKCRTLLDQNPSTEAIIAVSETIKWLNDESEIGSNFSGSFNGMSLGDLVSVSYFPSMESKMIQKYWEATASALPDYKEGMQIYINKKAEAKKRKREEKEAEEKRLKEKELREKAQKQKKEEKEKNERLLRIANSAEKTNDKREYLRPAQRIIGASNYAFAYVQSDGTVCLYESFISFNSEYKDVSRFKDIKSVVCTDNGVVGLRYDGRCISTNPGKDDYSNIRAVNSWSDIDEIAAGQYHVIGLKKDGTCVGNSINWSNIKAIACGDSFSLALTNEGTIKYAGEKDAKDAESWKDIAIIGAGGSGAIGITNNGEIRTAGEVDVNAMLYAENVVQVVVCKGCGYALQANGDVIGGTSKQYEIKKNHAMVVERNAVAIFAGESLYILKEDGTITTKFSRVNSWVKLPSNLKILDSYSEHLNGIKEREKINKQKEVWRNTGVCQYCGGTFKKTIFSNKCISCGKSKDYFN